MRELYRGTGKGILLPPIFTDITSDGTEDIIIATVNATIIAFNGLTLEHIWNYTVPNSEVISIPIPGYYNDDDVPDFMVKHQIGPGYPLYYYTVSTILDGKNGSSILEKSITDTLSGQMSGLSISVDEYGNDWFLHWSSNCLNHEDSHEKYRFLAGQSLLSQSRADLCKLRFNTTLVTRLWALSQHVGPPGQSIYFSEDWKTLEYNNSIDPRLEADKFLGDDTNFDDFTHILNEGLSLVSERSPGIDKIHRKTWSFRHRNTDKDKDDATDYYGKQQIAVPAENIDENKPRVPEVYEDNSSADNYQIYKEPKPYSSSRKMVNGNWMDRNDWQDGEKQYDTMYDGDPGELSRMSDVRAQRSDSTGQDDAPANKFEHYDLNMDYTNGASNYVKYSPVSQVESDFSLYNDEIVESQVQKNRRKRPGAETMRAKNFGRFAENEDYADIEEVFKRESMRNYVETKTFKTDNYDGRKKRNAWQEGGKMMKGIQRQPPTGILLPSVLPSTDKTSTDLVFSTYWLPPSEVSLILSERDLDCIKSKRSKKLQEYDNESIVDECLAERGINYKLYRESMSRENVKIPLGQMTVYRFKLECVCPEDMLPGQGCKNISHQQSWPAHLGVSANGFFKPSNNRRT